MLHQLLCILKVEWGPILIAIGNVLCLWNTREAHRARLRWLEGHKRGKPQDLPYLQKVAIGSVLVLVGLFGVFLAIYQGYRKNTDQVEHIEKTANDFLHKNHRRVKNIWWFPTLPDSVTPEFATFVEEKKQLLASVSKKYQRQSKLTQDIATLFANFSVGFHASGRFTSIEPLPKPGTQPVIFFLTADTLDRKQFPTSALWMPEKHFMTLYGIAWPEKVFPGIVLHEMAHAVYDMTYHAESATAEFEGDTWVMEELIANDLQHVVQNEESKGVYFREIEKIIGRFPVTSSPREVLAGLTADDLRRLDTSLSCMDAGYDAARRIIMDYLYVLGMHQLERAHATQKEKILFWQWRSKRFGAGQD